MKNQMNYKEVSALIKLLDDPDEEIALHVESKLMSMGIEVVPFLESEWETSFDAIIQQRIEQIISGIQFENVKLELRKWSEEANPDLFDGAYILCTYKYPDLDKQHLNNLIDKIRLDIWLELNHALTAFEKIKVLNHVFYNLYQFSANVSNYHAPQNSFINNVLENRKGNPVSLSVIYQIVANRLGIPVYGVNLPQHFVLAYKDEKLLDNLILETGNSLADARDNDGILFYINAFNRGALLTLANLEQFLRQLNLSISEKYLFPCSNIDIIKRMLRNLAFAYKQQSDINRAEQIKVLLNILGENIDFSDQAPPNENEDEDEDNED